MIGIRFVGVGACYLDTILSVSHFISEDEKLRASGIARRRGGNCPNTLEVLQQLLSTQRDLFTRVDLLAVLPHRSSSAVREVQQSLGSGVSLDMCLYRDDFFEPASSYIIKNLSNGSRTIINYNDLPEMSFDEFVHAVQPLKDAAYWYHFEGRIPDVTIDCIRYLRKAVPGVTVTVEIEKPQREGLQELVPEANLVFYSKSWAIGNGYSSAEECLRSQAKLAPKAMLLCCTWGEHGASALEPTGQTYCYQPAHQLPGTSVTDTIGAGDTFIAGMIYAYLAQGENWPLDQKLAFSNELAGRKVVQEGFSGLADVMSL